MEKYKVKLDDNGACLYGGKGVLRADEGVDTKLIVRVDEFGEQIQLKVTKYKPSDVDDVFNWGELGPGEAVTMNLNSIKRVEAKCTGTDFDSLVHCTILLHS